MNAFTFLVTLNKVFALVIQREKTAYLSWFFPALGRLTFVDPSSDPLSSKKSCFLKRRSSFSLLSSSLFRHGTRVSSVRFRLYYHSKSAMGSFEHDKSSFALSRGWVVGNLCPTTNTKDTMCLRQNRQTILLALLSCAKACVRKHPMCFWQSLISPRFAVVYNMPYWSLLRPPRFVVCWNHLIFQWLFDYSLLCLSW